MKNSTLLFILSITTLLVKAQTDVIYKFDRSEIKCKVVEITEQNTVKYKEADNMDGPLMNIKAEQVFMIQYANGKKWKPEIEVVKATLAPTNKSGGNNPSKTINSSPNTVTDIDGNVYNTVKIGRQTWMKENLKTTHFNDGSIITEVENKDGWKTIAQTRSQIPAWCYYLGEAGNNNVYGKLYNWFAVSDSRNVCPIGWHAPADAEIAQLVDYLGGIKEACTKMKGITLWTTIYNEPYNSSEFSALPSGYRYDNAVFGALGEDFYFWSATESKANYAWFWDLYGVRSDMMHTDLGKWNGFSVRCVKNQ